MKAYAWLFVLAIAGQAAASEPAVSSASHEAAEVVLLTGHGSALSGDGHARRLHRGDKLYAGDIVNSGADAYLNLHFRDGGFVLLRPNTRFQIEAYQYEPPATQSAPAASANQPVAADVTAEPPPRSRAFFRLLRGGFRAVSGLIGHGRSDEFRISTPVATIGIRGTDYIVILPSEAEAEELATQGGHRFSAKGGVVVGVTKGGVFMKNADGDLMDIGTGQYAMTLKNGKQLQLSFEPGFLKLTPLPDPVTACQ